MNATHVLLPFFVTIGLTPIGPPPAADDSTDVALLQETRQRLERVIRDSFPALEAQDIGLRIFRSSSDYFRTSFDPWRFVLGMTMRYNVSVNRELPGRHCPSEAIRAILAHELAHVEELAHGMRVRRLALVGLVFRSKTATFERRADLRAIALGYGPGLKAYRRWLYDNVPAERLPEKRRNYFSPEEIDAILRLTSANPALFDYWHRHVPKNLAAIIDGAGYASLSPRLAGGDSGSPAR